MVMRTWLRHRRNNLVVVETQSEESNIHQTAETNNEQGPGIPAIYNQIILPMSEPHHVHDSVHEQDLYVGAGRNVAVGN